MWESNETRRSFLRAGLALAGALAAGKALPAAPRTNDGALTAVTFIHGIAGGEQDLQTHLLSLAAPTRAEPGCIRYDLYQSEKSPHEFMRFEVWRSAEDLETHKQSPHLRASFEKRQREGWTTEITTWIRVPEDVK